MTDTPIPDKYKFDTIDKLIFKYKVSNPTAGLTEISRAIGTPIATVNYRTRQKKFLDAINEHFGTTSELLKRAQSVAIKALINIIQDEMTTKKDVIEAAKIVLAPLMAEYVSGAGKDRAPNEKAIEGIIFRTRIGKQGEIIKSEQEVLEAEIVSGDTNT